MECRRIEVSIIGLTAQRLTAESICDPIVKSHPVMHEVSRLYPGPFIAAVGRFADVRLVGRLISRSDDARLNGRVATETSIPSS